MRYPAYVLIAALGLTQLTRPAHAADNDLIILILVDALRADHVHSFGYPLQTTPVLDEFAGEGVSFTRAYVNAPWTRPSTASFLTGYNASRHVTETDKALLPQRVTTLAQRLKRKGYATAGFTANGNGGSLAGLEKGFDIFEDPSTSYPKKMRGKTYCCHGLPTGEFLVKRAMRWMRKNKDKKRFVFLFLVDPHDPYGAPPELERMFLGENYDGPVRRRASWEYNNDYSDQERHSLVALYDAGIRYADKAIGQFFDFLKKKRWYKDATIFVSADHGEGFGEHKFYLHAHHFWEEVIHVPIIAKGPKFAAGKVDTRLAQSIDITRTIADLAKVGSTDLPGHSLLGKEGAAHIISEYNEFGIHRQAIVGKRYKVIWQRPADRQWYMKSFPNRFDEEKKLAFFPSVSFDKDVIQVFDLEKDPKERNDLSKSMPPEAAELLAELRKFVDASDAVASNP